MLRTFRLVGTKTPEKVPSFSEPPTGLGKEPILGVSDLCFFCLSVLWCIWAVREFSTNAVVPLVLLPPLLDRRVVGGAWSIPLHRALKSRPKKLFDWACSRGGGLSYSVCVWYGSSGCSERVILLARDSLVSKGNDERRSNWAVTSVAALVENVGLPRGRVPDSNLPGRAVVAVDCAIDSLDRCRQTGISRSRLLPCDIALIGPEHAESELEKEENNSIDAPYYMWTMGNVAGNIVSSQCLLNVVL